MGAQLTKKLLPFVALMSVGFSNIVFSQDMVTINLNEAIRLTLSKSPELQTYVHRAESAKGMIEQAGVGSVDELNISVEDAFGTGQLSGINSAQTNVKFSWLLEQPLLNSRVHLASKKAGLNRLQKNAKAVSIAAKTAELFIRALSLKEQMKLAKLSEYQATQALNEIKTLVKRGKLNQITELRATADLSKKILVVEDLEHEILVAKNSLAAQWKGSNNFNLSGDLLSIPYIATKVQLLKQLKQTPTYQLFAEKQLVAEDEIQLAKVSATPAWRISTGIRRNEAFDDYGITAGITIPLGGENRNRGKITALKAEQLSQRSEAEAWFTKMSAEVYEINTKYSHNQHVIKSLNQKIIPTLSKANTAAQQTFKQGRFSYSDWYFIQQELLSAQTELIQSYTNIHLNQIELEQLTAAFISK